MQLGNEQTDVGSLRLERTPIEVVLTEDGATPLSLVLPPYEDLAEVKALQGSHISIKEIGGAAFAAFWTSLDMERRRLAKKAPIFSESSTFHIRMANLAAIAGDMLDEDRHLKEAVRIAPDEFTANRTIQNLFSRHLDNEAVKLLSERDLERDLYANLRLAGFYAKKEQVDQADRHVKLALKIDPLDFRARLFDGALRIWRGDYEQAILSFRVACELRPNSSAAHANMAVAYVRMNRNDKALRSLKSAINIDPLNLNAVTLLADVAHQQKRDSDSIPNLRYFLQFEQKRPEVWGRLARALLEVGLKDEAIAAIKRQASLQETTPAWNNLGVAYFAKKDFVKALESFKHAMTIAGSSSDFGYCLAARNVVAVANKTLPPAELLRFIDGVIDKQNASLFAGNAELSDILFAKIHFLSRLGRNKEAAELGEQLVASKNVSPVVTYKAVTSLLSVYGLYEETQNRALELANEFSERLRRSEIHDKRVLGQLLNNIAFVYIEHNLLDRAEENLSKLSNEIHRSSYPTATIGLFHLRKGHLDKAAKLYSESLRLCVSQEDKSRIRQKWDLEIGRALMNSEPKRALRHLLKAKDKPDVEPGIAAQAGRLAAVLGGALPPPLRS